MIDPHTTAPSSGEVFISYSWDSEEHIKNVLELSNRLRADGIDCIIDQYEVSPPEGWPRWMDRKIADACLVLVICTEPYLNRIMGREVLDKGNGVKWEGNIIYQHLYNSGSDNRKFIPVVLRDSDRKFIPVPLQGASFFSVESEKGYDRLYNRILGIPVADKPPLGKRQAMPKKEVKTNLLAYIEGPIDVELWDRAKWRATFFANRPNYPPMLGIGFLNKEPAEQIFSEWHHRYGTCDEFEELRIAIVEGDVSGEDPGYTVHIGVDVENTLKRYRQAGLELENVEFYATISRLNRMNPTPESPYLSLFKDSFKKSGEYLLFPAICESDGSNIQLAPKLGIRKRVLHLRNTKDLRYGDPDSVVLQTGEWKRPLTDYGKARV